MMRTLTWFIGQRGNPAPDWNGDGREGDNLYTNSVLALDPDTGEVKWYFQFTPHDVWDYDGNTGMFLLDVMRSGQSVKALAQPNRNGYMYVLNRGDGKFLHGSQYVEQLNWAKGLDENGRPLIDPKYVPMEGGNPELICPGNVGGQNGSYAAPIVRLPTSSLSRRSRVAEKWKRPGPFSLKVSRSGVGGLDKRRATSAQHTGTSRP